MWRTAAGVRCLVRRYAVPLPEPLLSELDDLVSSGAYESRAAAVRAGIEAITRLEHHRRTDQTIVDGYTRQPPTELPLGPDDGMPTECVASCELR